jgi:hypothetical protein
VAAGTAIVVVVDPLFVVVDEDEFLLDPQAPAANVNAAKAATAISGRRCLPGIYELIHNPPENRSQYLDSMNPRNYR